MVGVQYVLFFSPFPRPLLMTVVTLDASQIAWQSEFCNLMHVCGGSICGSQDWRAPCQRVEVCITLPACLRLTDGGLWPHGLLDGVTGWVSHFDYFSILIYRYTHARPLRTSHRRPLGGLYVSSNDGIRFSSLIRDTLDGCASLLLATATIYSPGTSSKILFILAADLVCRICPNKYAHIPLDYIYHDHTRNDLVFAYQNHCTIQ